MKVLIIEDEWHAQEELRYLLEKERDVSICGVASNTEEGWDLLFQEKPDVCFCDIEMPGEDGMTFVKKVSQAMKEAPLFVFTTAYPNYAAEAFEYEAVDYVLKPFDDVRLKRVMERLRRLVATRTVPAEREGPLLVDDGEQLRVIQPEAIYFAVSENRVVYLQLKDERIETKWTLAEVESLVGTAHFFKPHRSYLVNFNKIEAVTPWFNGAYNLRLVDFADVSIPVSRTARKLLFERFGQ